MCCPHLQGRTAVKMGVAGAPGTLVLLARTYIHAEKLWMCTVLLSRSFYSFQSVSITVWCNISLIDCLCCLSLLLVPDLLLNNCMVILSCNPYHKTALQSCGRCYSSTLNGTEGQYTSTIFLHVYRSWQVVPMFQVHLPPPSSQQFYPERDRRTVHIHNFSACI